MRRPSGHSEKSSGGRIAPRSIPSIEFAAVPSRGRTYRVDSAGGSRLNRGRQREANPGSMALSRPHDAPPRCVRRQPAACSPRHRFGGGDAVNDAEGRRSNQGRVEPEQRREIDRGCRRIKDGAAASGEHSGSRTNRPPPSYSTPNPPPHAIPSPPTPVALRTTLKLEPSVRDRICRRR